MVRGRKRSKAGAVDHACLRVFHEPGHWHPRRLPGHLDWRSRRLRHREPAPPTTPGRLFNRHGEAGSQVNRITCSPRSAGLLQACAGRRGPGALDREWRKRRKHQGQAASRLGLRAAPSAMPPAGPGQRTAHGHGAEQLEGQRPPRCTAHEGCESRRGRR